MRYFKQASTAFAVAGLLAGTQAVQADMLALKSLALKSKSPRCSGSSMQRSLSLAWISR